MDQPRNRNPLAVIALSLVIIGIAATALVPWMGELTLPAIAIAGILAGIPALVQAQKGAGRRGMALISVACGVLSLVLFTFLKVFRT